MDLRDLVKLAGIVNPEVLNKLEPTVEADGAGFEDATTRPQEEMMDDPMATMGSDADLSLRRYLKAKGDHVTVDEEVYPDHTVESVTEAYAAFKAESATPNLDKEIAAYFKQIRTPAKGFGGKLKAEAEESVEEATVNEEKRYQIRYLPYDSDKFKIVKGFTSKEEAEKYAKAENFDELADEWNIEAMNEATMGAPDYNPAKASAGGPGYASMPQQVKLAGDSIWDKEGTNPPMITITDYEVSEEDGYVSVTVEHDGPMEVYTDSGFEKAVSDMIGMDVEFSEQGMQDDGVAHFEGEAEMESVEIDEPEVGEGNAYSGALAKAKAAGADEFEVDGKVHKVKEASKPDYIDIDGDGDKEESMKKAAKDKEEDEEVDESLDILKKLAGL